MAKTLIVFLAAAALTLGLASTGLAEAGRSGMEEEIKGTVTRIEGNTVTIKDFMGVEKTVELKNPESLGDLRIGDPAVIRDGFLSKESWGGSEDLKPGTPSGGSTPRTNPHTGSGY